MTETETVKGDHQERVFLVVVDESPEMHVAMKFACRRAARTGGRVAMLYVIEPAEFGHWMKVSELMREEAREEAENLLHSLSENVKECSGKMPLFYVREGLRSEAVLELVKEEQDISVLVLAAHPGSEGPGPLITSLTSKHAGRLRVPITIVPGALSDEDVTAIT